MVMIIHRPRYEGNYFLFSREKVVLVDSNVVPGDSAAEIKSSSNMNLLSTRSVDCLVVTFWEKRRWF